MDYRERLDETEVNYRGLETRFIKVNYNLDLLSKYIFPAFTHH